MSDAARSSTSRPRPAGIRWWPLLVILILAAGALVWAWTADATSRQNRVLNTLATLTLTLLATVVWLLALSRLRLGTRLLWAAALVLLGVAARYSIEVRSVSGDVMPIVAFRWSPKVDQTLATDLGSGAQQAVAATVHDFPQFLGARRNATVEGVRLARDWRATPPELLWRRPVGAGASGFAVVGTVAITHEQRGEQEMVVAYRLRTGEPLWSYGVETRHVDLLGGDGPRATPAIHDGRVYALGATGTLSCLDLATGEPLWSRDVLADAGAAKPTYGLSGSPLVDGDQVVVIAGGRPALLAYHRLSGERLWSSGSYPAAYASPLRATFGGVPQLVIFHNAGLTGHTLDGTELWHTGWPNVEKTSQPVPLDDDRLFVSSGYGAGCALYRLRRDDDGAFAVEGLWHTRRMKAKLTQVVHRQGYIYGLDDGVLVSLDLTDGERAWKRGRYGHGQILLVGDLLLVVSEKGEVALVEAVPDEHRELGRFQALDGKTWNTPALAGPYLLVRNDHEAACFRLPLDS